MTGASWIRWTASVHNLANCVYPKDAQLASTAIASALSGFGVAPVQRRRHGAQGVRTWQCTDESPMVNLTQRVIGVYHGYGVLFIARAGLTWPHCIGFTHLQDGHRCLVKTISSENPFVCEARSHKFESMVMLLLMKVPNASSGCVLMMGC